MHPSYNHNIVYRGHTLHVQTEDHGPPRCAIVTHVFSAGDVITSLRQTYAAGAAEADPDAHTAAMQTQHRAAMRAMLRGAHDAALVARGLVLPPAS